MKPHQKVVFENTGRTIDWENNREIIHHKDGNHKNNSLENLEVMTQSEHMRKHFSENGNWMNTEEANSKKAESKYGNQHALGAVRSEETLKRLSASLKGKGIGNSNATGQRSEEKINNIREGVKKFYEKINSLGFERKSDYIEANRTARRFGFKNYEEHLKDYLEDRKMVEEQIEGMKE